MQVTASTNVSWQSNLSISSINRSETETTPFAALAPIDLSAYRAGNAGVPYLWRFSAARPGPTAMITALVHGNELCGAHALSGLLERDLRPKRGVLILAFANVDAYARFDPDAPHSARFLDEDMNRLWSQARLREKPRSREHARALMLMPFVTAADQLLDLHSMSQDGPPLTLCGSAPKGAELATRLGLTELVVADDGHHTGTRLRDYGAFAAPGKPQTALLVECGSHYAPSSAAIARRVALRFLAGLGTIDGRAWFEPSAPGPKPARPIRITHTVIAKTPDFTFARDFGAVTPIPKAGTVIAWELGRPIVTPYRDAVLIMPATRPQQGQTAVRIGHYEAAKPIGPCDTASLSSVGPG